MNPETSPATTPPLSVVAEPGERIQRISIDLIDPSPYQPRTRFRSHALEDLANSIRASGIIQALIVRTKGSRFQLIAGERRWRAAQMAGLMDVPAVVRDVDDLVALELTIVENLQREDLNPIEQARAFERLTQEFNFSQDEIAEQTGKDRVTIANAVRLLKLEPEIQSAIEEGSLSASHGRALLAVDDLEERMALARRAARGLITVRQIERAARRKALRPQRGRPGGTGLDANLRAALEELQQVLGTKVQIRVPVGNLPGQIAIDYYDDSQLQMIYARLLT